MNPYQIVGIIAGSMLVFAAIVATLTWLGLPLLVAFLGVYFVTMWFMIGMQKRAQLSCHFREQRRTRAFDMPSADHQYDDAAIRPDFSNQASNRTLRSSATGYLASASDNG